MWIILILAVVLVVYMAATSFLVGYLYQMWCNFTRDQYEVPAVAPEVFIARERATSPDGVLAEVSRLAWVLDEGPWHD